MTCGSGSWKPPGTTTLSTGNVSLRSRAGSIIDGAANGAGDAAADVLGQTIDIDAHGGSIGTAAKDLDIDSLRGSPFACTNVNCANNRTTGPPTPASPPPRTTSPWRPAPASTSRRPTRTCGCSWPTRSTGNIRITVRESAELDEDLFLIRNGTANFAEDNTTVPGNDADHLRSVPVGTVFAETGSVELRVGDDLTFHQNTQVLANLGIDIRGDFGNLDTGGTLAVPDPEYGSSMILRGRIIADCVVTAGRLHRRPDGQLHPQRRQPRRDRQTHIRGGSDVDLIQLGDPSGLDLAQTTNPALNKEQLGDAGYIFLGSKTTVHGNATAASTPPTARTA